MNLEKLSPDGLAALLTALRNLPDDRGNPQPLCGRVSKVLDLLQALALRKNLAEGDRVLFRQWCTIPDALLRCSLLVHMVDVFRRVPT